MWNRRNTYDLWVVLAVLIVLTLAVCFGLLFLATRADYACQKPKVNKPAIEVLT